MKARDKVRLETLRNIKKVFLEAKTAPGANDTLEDADALKLLSKLAKQGKESAATYVQQNRQDLADNELALYGRPGHERHGPRHGPCHQADGRPRRRRSHLGHR